MVMYCSDGSGYPGSPGYNEINTVTHKGEDITEFFDEADLMEDLQEAITKQ